MFTNKNVTKESKIVIQNQTKTQIKYYQTKTETETKTEITKILIFICR